VAEPPFRLALMHPVHRDLWYAANETYLAAELAVLDQLADRWVTLGAFFDHVTAAVREVG